MASQPQKTGEGFSSGSVEGMSLSQLYDKMAQLKVMMEQNRKQAKQILVEQPEMTKALFKAQIMLGMVRPSQPADIPQAVSSQQPAQVVQQSAFQTTHSLPVQPSHQGQTSLSQPFVSIRQHHHQPQSTISLPSAPFQSQRASSVNSYQQTQAPENAQIAPHSSRSHNLPALPALPPYPNFQTQMPTVSSQGQPSLQIPGLFNQPLQPPMPQQPRPSSIQSFPHQHQAHMSPLGFQQSVPQQHLSQPIFHSTSNLGPSFPQGQPPLPSQPPPQHLYQGGQSIGLEYNNQVRTSMLAERGSQWIPGLPERATGGPQLLGPPPAQMAPGLGAGQPSRPPPPPLMTADSEKDLIKQVMSLTPEQINLLPLEQRQQVVQLQNILRQ